MAVNVEYKKEDGLGNKDGSADGNLVGIKEGNLVGVNVGTFDGTKVLRATEVGPTVGIDEDGLCVDGVEVGAKLGTVEGVTVAGRDVGRLTGAVEGIVDTGLDTGSENDIDEAEIAPDELHFSFRHTRVNSALNSPLTTLDRN